MAPNLDLRFYECLRAMLTGGLAARQTDPTFIELSPQEAILLEIIEHLDSATMSEIGRASGTQPSTMTGVVDRLVRRGILTRDSSPEDRRIVLVRLTELGSRLHAQHMQFFREFAANLLAVLSTDERLLLVDLLERVTTPLRA
ncbi:MAG: MarR family transcriptional regulator [Deltaproteobacteria bacterium]|nr:MarR family transcriptional regulator [Deltaproteobacteria bacterium]